MSACNHHPCRFGILHQAAQIDGRLKSSNVDKGDDNGDDSYTFNNEATHKHYTKKFQGDSTCLTPPSDERTWNSITRSTGLTGGLSVKSTETSCDSTLAVTSPSCHNCNIMSSDGTTHCKKSEEDESDCGSSILGSNSSSTTHHHLLGHTDLEDTSTMFPFNKQGRGKQYKRTTNSNNTKEQQQSPSSSAASSSKGAGVVGDTSYLSSYTNNNNSQNNAVVVSHDTGKKNHRRAPIGTSRGTIATTTPLPPFDRSIQSSKASSVTEYQQPSANPPDIPNHGQNSSNHYNRRQPHYDNGRQNHHNYFYHHQDYHHKNSRKGAPRLYTEQRNSLDRLNNREKLMYQPVVSSNTTIVPQFSNTLSARRPHTQWTTPMMCSAPPPPPLEQLTNFTYNVLSTPVGTDAPLHSATSLLEASNELQSVPEHLVKMFSSVDPISLIQAANNQIYGD